MEKENFKHLLSELYEKISEDLELSSINITAYKSPEPLKFADRFLGKEERVFEGKAWSKKLFDCAWMRFDISIDDEEISKGLALKIDINGELCIVDDEGNPLQGLTCKSSDFSEILGKPAKRLYEIPAHLLKSTKFSIWADCALNDLFGTFKNNGILACAKVVKIDETAQRLYADFDYAISAAYDFENAVKNQEAMKLAISAASKLIKKDFNANKLAACKALEKEIFIKGKRPKFEVSAIGHAHMDLAWLWPIRETKRKLARTFATALTLIEKYPFYIYGASQPQSYLWMKEDYPKLYERIKKAVSVKRIEPLGAMWIEPDCNMPSGEAFVRQIILGKKFFKDEFGIIPNFFWIPDSFGYSPQLPQILLKSGVKYFITQKLSWNLINRFPHHSFWWEGIDGSKVLAHLLPEETYNSPALPRSVMKIERTYAQKDVSNKALMAFGIGDGGGGPGPEHLDRIAINAKSDSLPEIKVEAVSKFLKEFEKDAKKFPNWKGDLYLERHQGTLTTQGLNKYYNRRCEGLLRDAEILCYHLEMLSKKKQDTKFLEEIWKEVLLYQFHDILPGSSIKRVYDESQARYKAIVESLQNYIESSAAKISELADLGDYTAFTTESHFFSLYGKVSDNKAVKNNILENDFLFVKFNKAGNLVSLKDKKSGKEFIDKKNFANEFLVYADNGDAWDFGYDYRNQTPEKMSLESAKIIFNEELKLTFKYKNSTLVQTIKLDNKVLRFDVNLDWQEKRKMLRVRFPLGFKAKKSMSEVAFGYYEREVDDANLWRKARIETPAHQWVNMQGADEGLALLNNAKYGFRLKDNAIEMAILRCVPCPAGALVFATDKLEARNKVKDDFADVGSQEFSYELFPHIGDFEVSEIVKRARHLNSEIIYPFAEGEAISVLSLVPQITNENVELAALKPAENGKGWIARLVNISAKKVTASMKLQIDPKNISEVDLSEKEICKNASLKNIKFTPFEVKSFLLKD